MNTIVLMKQTFDTEEKITLASGEVSEDGAKFVINPYDEYAVEQAIQLREQFGGKVTVVTAGPDRSAEALRTALAMGVDEAVHLCDERLPQDAWSVSRALAAWIAEESYDLILGGFFSVDQGAGQVAVRLAKLLGLPHAAAVTWLEIDQGQALVRRDAEGDVEVLALPLPALITAQQGLNEPRYPTLQGIMKAKKKPYRQLTLDDLGLSEDNVKAKTETVRRFLPPARNAGKLIKGDPLQKTTELIRLLQDEAKLQL